MCSICGEPASISDGVIGADICGQEPCFNEAWDRAWGR